MADDFDYSFFDNLTGGVYNKDLDSDSVSISLEDLLATDTDNFDFGYDPYDTSPLDALFPDTPKKDDKNAFQRLLGAFGVGGGGGGGKSKVDPLQALLGLGLASYGKDRGFFNPDVPDVGYQGEIPKYQAIQEVVKGRDDSGRRPGSGGRRYMSDVIYAKAPENQEPMSVAEAQAKAKAQAQGFAEGGYLNGDSDGQADEVPGSIDGVQEARLSHGEYVLPADLVSLLGNGNSDAGAKALDDFMAMVRKQGTGTEKQQKNIKADKVLASLMQGKG